MLDNFLITSSVPNGVMSGVVMSWSVMSMGYNIRGCKIWGCKVLVQGFKGDGM